MTLVACRECLKPVEYNAHLCPHCGARQPNGRHLLRTTFIVLLVCSLLSGAAYLAKDLFPLTAQSTDLPAGDYELAKINGGFSRKVALLFNGLDVISKIGTHFTVKANGDTILVTGVIGNGKQFRVEKNGGSYFLLDIPDDQRQTLQLPFRLTSQNHLQFTEGADSLVYIKAD